MSEILQVRKEIEEQGDDIKDQGFDWLYRIAPLLSFIIGLVIGRI